MSERDAFTYIECWPAVSDSDGEAIRAFWQSEGAIVDERVARERLRQVVMFARTSDGTVAGVCTAVAMVPPRFGQPMYYWRTFVGKPWRSSLLVIALLKRSCVLLEAWARQRDFPCIGILLELENERFGERGRKAVWVNPRFVYVGRSDRGLDIRAFYFAGVRLKPPADAVVLPSASGA